MASKEIIMFYNVENFFSADPAPLHRSDPTPSGLPNWNGYRYKNKLFKISHAVELLAAEAGKLPAVIGLSEIQGKKVLQDLVRQPVFKGKYDFIHFDSLDERGVDTAMIFDKNTVKILHAEPITFFFNNETENNRFTDTTRDVLWCKSEIYGEMIHIFVVHLPSKRADDINKPKRDYILRELDEKFKNTVGNTREAIILMGDFNENPDEESLQMITAPEGAILRNPALALFQNKTYSTFHRNDGLLYDQILLSGDFFQEDAPLKFSRFAVFNNEKISERSAKFAGRPFRTYAGTRYIGGYSDHFPVFAEFFLDQKTYEDRTKP